MHFSKTIHCIALIFAHKVGFSVAKSSNDMKIYLKYTVQVTSQWVVGRDAGNHWIQVLILL